jgi:chromosome segregation ATPase
MSQKGSSIVSSDNPEVKYKKALMEIQKIHNANKVLKGQSEEMKAEYERQLHELEESLHHLEKENDAVKNDKAELEKFLEELQVSNTELRKEYNNLEREVSYLNDVLTEQNTELKKVNAFKDEKGLTALIASYEDREIAYRKDIARQEELLRSLRTSCDSLDNDLAEERRQRYKAEDLNNALRIEIAKYRELNSSLISKNEAVVAGLVARSSEGKEKYREAEAVLGELGRQLELVRSSRAEQQALQRTTVTLESYESLLQEKGRVESEVQRLRARLEESEARAQEVFVAEERMKQATLKADRLQEECNMLKSKLVVVETKELMEGGEDGELK